MMCRATVRPLDSGAGTWQGRGQRRSNERAVFAGGSSEAFFADIYTLVVAQLTVQSNCRNRSE